jgi:uncharacterized protein (TIGR02246 family)
MARHYGPVEQWQLIARESVRDLVARYNAAGDSGRFDEVLSLFAPDAVLDVDGIAYVGHDQIRSLFDGAAEAFREGTGPVLVRHYTSTLQIDVDGPAQARSRCYYQVLMSHGLDHWGRYIDDYAVIGSRWVFTRRREMLDGTTAGGWAARRVERAR